MTTLNPSLDPNPDLDPKPHLAPNPQPNPTVNPSPSTLGFANDHLKRFHLDQGDHWEFPPRGTTSGPLQTPHHHLMHTCLL